MLYFSQNEVCPCTEKVPCLLCRSKVATWEVRLLSDERVCVCAYCLLYSGKTKWGHENRKELLEVGRAAQQLAAKHRQPIPEIDQRGRLNSFDAEKFIMGVSFTSRMVLDRMGVL